MTTRKKARRDANELRRRAEDIDREKIGLTPEMTESLSPEATWQLIHELRVHQLELEMQNNELRHSQAELEASRALYFDFYNLAPVGYLTLTSQARILEANLTIATLLGVTRTSLVRHSLNRFICPEDQDRFYLHLKQLFAKGASRLCELRLTKSNGDQLWVQMETDPVQAETGATQVRVVVSDISERKQTEDALRENGIFLNTLLDAIPAPVFYKDSAGYYIGVNKAFENFYGRTHQELVGKSVFDIAPQEIASVYHEKDLELLRQPGKQVYETQVKDAQDVVHDVIFYKATFTGIGGNVRGLIGAILDITERKQAEESLHESEKRFRELVRDVNAVIFTRDKEGKITFMNEYGLSFFGYADQELIGKTEIETILPEYESTGRNLHEIFAEITDKSSPHQRQTHENITKSRKRVWVDWTRRCMANRETGDMESICVGVDITAARRAEQEQFRLHDRLKKRAILNDGINRHSSQAKLLDELRQVGLILEPPFVLSLLAIPAEYLDVAVPGKEQVERQYQIDLLINSLNSSNVGIAWQAPAGIAVVKSINKKRSRQESVAHARSVAKELINTVSRYWQGKALSVGVSHSSEAAQELAVIYEQACAALQFGPVLEKGKAVYHWSELGCFQLLVKNIRSTQVQEFIQDQLGPILNTKHAGKCAEELTVLEALISGDSHQVSAGRFGVHKQTMVFRKNKLEKKLGVDLDAQETRTNLSIAMKMLSLLA